MLLERRVLGCPSSLTRTYFGLRLLLMSLRLNWLSILGSLSSDSEGSISYSTDSSSRIDESGVRASGVGG